MSKAKRRSKATESTPNTHDARLIGPAVLALSVAGTPVFANPQGGQVVAGSATIDQSLPGETTISQATRRAIINWDSFSVGAGETTEFRLPSANAVTLNRVTGGDPSQILGNLKSNGNLFIVNGNGVLFGRNARVDVNGLVATTHDIRDDDFMAGRYRFTIPGNPKATVINEGRITAGEAGLVALVAPGVINRGVITARLGRVALGSANGFTLDLYGDGLVQLAVDPVTLPAVTPDGRPVSALVENSGTINVEGGTVLLTAQAARGVVDNVINNSGVISATSARAEGGRIILEAGDYGNVQVTGTLDASGTTGGRIKVNGGRVMVSGDAEIAADGSTGTGGKVQLLGRQVGITDRASVSADGRTGGGTVLVGGDYQGKNPNVRNARDVYFGPDATISADALQSGNGGKVIFWSNHSTQAYGSVSATGGRASGNGGLVETSSHGVLDVAGFQVDATADHGSAGRWLLDPTDVTIVSGGGGTLSGGVFNPGTSSSIGVDVINSALGLGNHVTIQTNATGTGGHGDITVNSNVAISGSNGTLTLNAYRNINILSNASFGGTDTDPGMTLNLISDSGGSGTGATYVQDNVTFDLFDFGTLRFSGGDLYLNGSGIIVSRGTLLSDGSAALIGSNYAALQGTVLGGNLTLGGQLDAGYMQLAQGANVTVRGDVQVGSGIAVSGGTGNATVTLAGGTLHANAVGGSAIDTGITVRGYGTLGNDHAAGAAAWTNNGTIRATTAGQALTINSDTFTNNNAVGVSAGTLNLNAANWTNTAGHFDTWGGTLNLGGSGTFYMTDLNFGTRNGGTVNITGHLFATGEMVDTGATTFGNGGLGGLVGNGASITGGTIYSSDGTPLNLTGRPNLDDVTLQGHLTVNGNMDILSSLYLANNAVINKGGGNWYATDYGSINIGPDPGNTATLISTGGGIYADSATAGGNLLGGVTVTLTEGLTLRGWGTLGDSLAAQVFINQGTILANTDGRAFTIDTADFTNQNTGVIRLAGGNVNLDSATWTNAGSFQLSSGVLNLGGNFSLADLGSFAGRDGGTVNITGHLNLSGGTLNIGSSGHFGSGGLGAVVGNSATISGGTIAQNDPGTVLNLVGRPNLGNVVLGSANGTLVMNGDADISGTIGIGYGATVNMGDSIWRLGPGPTTVIIGPSAGTATLISTGGGIYTNTTITEGQSLTLASGLTMRGYFTIGDLLAPQNLTVNGTLVSSVAGRSINLDSARVVLNGATLTGTGDFNIAGDLNVTGGAATVSTTGTLTTRGTTTLSASLPLMLVGTTWHNTGTVDLGGYGLSFLGGSILNNDGVINLNTVMGNAMGGEGAGGTLNNAGTVNQLSSMGNTLTNYVSVNNTGTVDVRNGTLTIAGNGTSPGRFVIQDGSTLNLAGTQRLGSTMQITGSGNVELTGEGITFTSSATTITNGHLIIAVDNGPIVVGSITQPAHGTVIDNGDGTFTYIPESGYSGTDTFTFQVSGQAGGAVATVTINVAPLPNEAQDPQPVILASNSYGAGPASDAPEVVLDLGGLNLPLSLSNRPLADIVAGLGGYSQEQQAAFYESLTAGYVTGSLKASGHYDLAGLLGKAAAGGKTSAAELRALLVRAGLSQAQQGWLGVYMRMRQLGMQQLLSPAVDALRNNPDAADEVDDGASGGPIALDAPTELKTDDGLVQVSGRVKSASKAVELRVNGRWVHVDEQGRFSFRAPVHAGVQHLVLQARDPAGVHDDADVQVASAADGRQEPVKGRRVALLVAVQEYDNSIPELETPVADAEYLAGALKSQYGFEAQVLANPTKRELIDTLRKVIGGLGENDSFAIFYAGHGYLMKETGRGYWLPRDADTGNPRNWVSNRDVARLFQRARARQILLISDSCYSGAFVGGGSDTPTEGDVDGRAVMAFSSGGVEPVWDGGGEGHSLFAASLVEGLEQGGSASGGQLFRRVRGAVVKASPQVPQYGAMVSAGYDPGADYLLKQGEGR